MQNNFTPLYLYLDDIYAACRSYLEKKYGFVDACDIYQIIASDGPESESYLQFETGCDGNGNAAIRCMETGEITVLCEAETNKSGMIMVSMTNEQVSALHALLNHFTTRMDIPGLTDAETKLLLPIRKVYELLDGISRRPVSD